MLSAILPLETPVPGPIRDDRREIVSLHEREDFHVRVLVTSSFHKLLVCSPAKVRRFFEITKTFCNFFAHHITFINSLGMATAIDGTGV